MLKASRDAGVKSVVMTSSIAAIVYGRHERAEPFTEADWTDETNRNDTTAYERSKTIAERAAWAWHKAEGGALELVTGNPALVLGPVLGSDFSASLEAIKKLLDGSVPGVPRFGFSVVDVRDIAQLHLLAMTAPAAAGQRFIGSSDFYWMKDMAKILKQGLGRGRFRPFPSWTFSYACLRYSIRSCAVGFSNLGSVVWFLQKKLGACWVGRRGRHRKPFLTRPGAFRRKAWFRLLVSWGRTIAASRSSGLWPREQS